MSAQAGAQKLQQLQASGLQLATHSLQLLSLSDPKEQQAYAASSRDAANNSLSFITCMGVIRQTADEVGLQCGTDSSFVHNSSHNGQERQTSQLACTLPELLHTQLIPFLGLLHFWLPNTDQSLCTCLVLSWLHMALNQDRR